MLFGDMSQINLHYCVILKGDSNSSSENRFACSCRI